ncbi:probable E3 ubiquitin-protein ligase ZFP1 isoform X2 [Neltuma alba]|uniref:probable E3 ubiquitin-protein ligase ZFP1 isoform X2 n=1 Tax=Neltuma alba TaxID=207710 RepID=UPI0010A4F305|nr:probable E3 ubiquitin-protein ligase ZFP1 isoform X2 [Prosopis alba]
MREKSAHFDCIDEMTHSDMDRRRHGNSNSEPSTVVSSANILRPNIRAVAMASGNTSNVDSHYSPDVYDTAVMHRGTQYNAIQNQRNLDMGVAAVANLHYSGMNPSSSTGVLPLPSNHGAYDQLPASTTFAVYGVSSDNFGRISSYADDVRASFKRKNAETVRGNFPHFDASASSSVVPPDARHSDGVTIMDTASLPPPQFRGNSIPSPMDLGPFGSLWSRSGESVMVHEHSHLIQGNYLGQPFQPVAPPWLDQQLNNSHSDGHATAWNQSLPMPYVQAPNVNGSSLENATMGLQRYHDSASNINGLRFVHPLVNHQYHNYHHPAVPMRGFRGHNIMFQPPVTAASYRVPTNPLRNAVIPAQNGFEMGHRPVGLVPSAGLQVYRPHRGYMNETTIGHRNLHPMGYLQVDDVAILDEVGLVDHHRDMRLDIEDMSYEELLALSERIGNVSTGLSEESISALMKTRIYATPTIINLEEEEASEDQETDSCTICLEKYENKQKIGILQCGHEYHAHCLKRWLKEKNVCPICKSEALSPGKDKDIKTK